ncbi:urea ABC transporter permease subunit UrtB [Chitinimonas naiadis]
MSLLFLTCLRRGLLPVLLALAASLAYALGLPQLQTLASGENDARIALIEQLGQRDDPHALSVLQALKDDALLISSDGGVLLLQHGKVVDPLSGQASPLAAEQLEHAMLNNRVRRALDAALAQLQLGHPDPTVRLAAVQALAEQSGAALLPRLRQRLDKESDAAVRVALTLAVARTELQSPDAAVRAGAARTLGESATPQIRTLLEAAAGTEKDVQVATELASSLREVKQRLFWAEVAGQLFTGVSLGSILLLAALGLAITYGLLGVINMAHGEMLMIGAYCTYLVQGLFRQYFPAAQEAYLLAALPVAFLVTGLLGVALERLIIRHLYGRPLETLLATWGISLMLMQAVRLLFGAQNVEVANPGWMSGGWQVLPNLILPYNRLVIIVFAMAVLLAVWLIINKTRLGLFVRAVTQHRPMAACVGVSTARVDMLAFGLGSGIAGLAGVALSQIGNVGPDLGQSYIVDSFMVVVLGGVGQLAGTVLASLGLGMLAKLLEPQIGAVLAKIGILLLIVLFIQKRPMGLFALKGRLVER